MSISTSLFCDFCGAANEMQASYCCFCGRPLLEKIAVDQGASAEPILVGSSDGKLATDTLLHARYRIITPVGQGGMGTVYRALDTQLNERVVAVKELVVNDRSSQAGKEALAAFKHETRLLSGLQHPNLPGIFEQFEENERFYLVMTFLEGQTLEEILQRSSFKKLSLYEVLQIGQQLCEVLQFLHSQYPPIIFRDVKPANIMRTSAGKIYLIDFGVARQFKPGQKKDTVPFGSLGYAPPEQFGKAQTTPRSDIYSLGATLFQLLSGYEPDTTPLQLPQIRSLEPGVPFALATLITKMLDKDETKRPANMVIVQQKLQEVATTVEPPLQPLSSFPPLTVAPKPRRFWRRLAVALLALCCILGSGFIGDTLGFSKTARIDKAQATHIATLQTQTTNTDQINATATAIQVAALPDPYPPAGTLAIVNPLNQSGAWQEQTHTNWGEECQFKNNMFQISQSKTERFEECDDPTDSTFSNFALQVTMTIVQGDCGGITFRESPDGSTFYLFDVCANGTYFLYDYISYFKSATLTVNETSTAIHQGGTPNVVAVVALGSTLDLYVNAQKIESVINTDYDSGSFGMVADSGSQATIVDYQNLMLWSLS
jgi:serine/threonine protein kinase